MAFIDPTTFLVETSEQNEHLGTIERGTVEVTIRRETRRVEATRYSKSGDITARGMTGRYQTGGKAWPATISLRHTERGSYESVWFGRDDRCGKFRKENGVSFA